MSQPAEIQGTSHFLLETVYPLALLTPQLIGWGPPTEKACASLIKILDASRSRHT